MNWKGFVLYDASIGKSTTMSLTKGLVLKIMLDLTLVFINLQFAFTKKAGCDDFISKPINEKTLSTIVNKYLIIK